MIRSAYIASRKSILPLTTRLVGPFLYSPGISLAMIQSAPISDAVAELCSLWFTTNTDAVDQGFTRSSQYYDGVLCTTNTSQPVVLAKCSINEMTTLRIPPANVYFPAWRDSVRIGPIPSGSDQWHWPSKRWKLTTSTF